MWAVLMCTDEVSLVSLTDDAKRTLAGAYGVCLAVTATERRQESYGDSSI